MSFIENNTDKPRRISRRAFMGLAAIALGSSAAINFPHIVSGMESALSSVTSSRVSSPAEKPQLLGIDTQTPPDRTNLIPGGNPPSQTTSPNSPLRR